MLSLLCRTFVLSANCFAIIYLFTLRCVVLCLCHRCLHRCMWIFGRRCIGAMDNQFFGAWRVNYAQAIGQQTEYYDDNDDPAISLIPTYSNDIRALKCRKRNTINNCICKCITCCTILSSFNAVHSAWKYVHIIKIRIMWLCGTSLVLMHWWDLLARQKNDAVIRNDLWAHDLEFSWLVWRNTSAWCVSGRIYSFEPVFRESRMHGWTCMPPVLLQSDPCHRRLATCHIKEPVSAKSHTSNTTNVYLHLQSSIIPHKIHQSITNPIVQYYKSVSVLI